MKQKKNLPLPTSIAKQRVQSAGIPIIPGYSGEDQSIETLVHEGKKIGYLNERMLEPLDFHC